MSDGIKKYIIISATILLILVTIGLCFLVQKSWVLVLVFSYLFGISNGMIIIGITNRDD